jgi:hypothetical protein
MTAVIPLHVVWLGLLIPGMGSLSQTPASYTLRMGAVAVIGDQAQIAQDRQGWTQRMIRRGFISEFQEPRATVKGKWEYRVLTKDEITELSNKNFAAGLNKLGEDGWELVAVEPGFSNPPGKPAEYYFKRAK